MPIIYLTAAFESGHSGSKSGETPVPLPALVDEVKNIEKSLSPLDDRNIWEVRTNLAAYLGDIFDMFQKKGDEIVLFHYAGHAGQRELRFGGGGQIKGIASLFGIFQQKDKPLQLVFLNGCNSAGMVEDLHQAGISAVIATSCPIEDESARVFAQHFYQSWAREGETLSRAFELARAAVQSIKTGENRSIGFVNAAEAKNESPPWGLYLNPALSEAQEDKIMHWQINPPPQLPPQVLKDVRTQATASLTGLVQKFIQSDSDARKEVDDDGKDQLLVLITRLPWTIGSHMRRLFAIASSEEILSPGVERLRELLAGYTELTRFLCYLSLSVLWDELRKAKKDTKVLQGIPALPVVGESIDYIARLKHYFELQKKISGDPFGLEAYLQTFLHSLDKDKELYECYRFMEELKLALQDDKRLIEITKSRTGKADGISALCLQAETIFARFIEEALFLTQFKLYSIRSVLVDKIRFLDLEKPFVHRSMTLHGAFGDIKLSKTARAEASENACILLAPRKQPENDPLSLALNLSPFYIDKSTYLSDKIGSYPAIYVLKHLTDDHKIVFEYLDGDVNHHYLFSEDLQLIVNEFGAEFPAELNIGFDDSARFGIVYKQLLQFQKDFNFS